MSQVLNAVAGGAPPPSAAAASPPSDASPQGTVFAEVIAAAVAAAGAKPAPPQEPLAEGAQSWLLSGLVPGGEVAGAPQLPNEGPDRIAEAPFTLALAGGMWSGAPGRGQYGLPTEPAPVILVPSPPPQPGASPTLPPGVPPPPTDGLVPPPGNTLPPGVLPPDVAPPPVPPAEGGELPLLSTRPPGSGAVPLPEDLPVVPTPPRSGVPVEPAPVQPASTGGNASLPGEPTAAGLNGMTPEAALTAPSQAEATASGTTPSSETGPPPQAAGDSAPSVTVASAPGTPANAGASATTGAEAPLATDDGPQLVRSLADTVEGAALRGRNEVRLRLDPPQLGHVDVRVTEHEGALRVVFEAASREAMELIQRHVSTLQQALEARDIRIERVEVQLAERSADGSDDLARDEADGRQPGSQGSADEQGNAWEPPQWSTVAALDGVLTNGADAADGDDRVAGDTARADGDGKTPRRLDVFA